MTAMSARVMYLHTLDGKPASFADMHGAQFLYFASVGHRSRAATLVPSLDQIRREQQRCIASAWREWNASRAQHHCERPNLSRYGYVLVNVAVADGVR